MVSLLEEPAAMEHCGDDVRSEPQNSAAMPQKPKPLQHTFNGQSVELDHCAPQPGSHSDL